MLPNIAAFLKKLESMEIIPQREYILVFILYKLNLNEMTFFNLTIDRALMMMRKDERITNNHIESPICNLSQPSREFLYGAGNI